MKKGLRTDFSKRQYMVSQDFEVYYYQDSNLNKVEEHFHNYYEFYFFLEGEVSMDIEGKEYPLKVGDVILIPPGIRHHVVIRSQGIPYRRFVFWISEDYCNHLTQVSTDYVYLMQRARTAKEYIFHNEEIGFHTVQAKVFRLIEEVHAERYGREAMLSLCANDLILHLNRVAYEQAHPKTQKEEERFYQNLMEFIEEHLDEELSLEKLGKEFYLSKYHIAHVFKEYTGLSIHQYLIKKRLEACKNAILSGRQITEVYLLFGFRDYSSFYRAFKKEYGISPKECREFGSVPEKER